ncbi:phage tail tube protein [Phaeobacter gallaeciensis]|uniref:phage tail tube protein n=1 Tax=Phaeobacter gallaeciensis TaxID=60890 RepID=UPI00237F6C94|nr:phage tail tube protein [Phaeobacter gallaeciensis]MDE4059771.1 phage tail tube protein [Phaeobacter gallaeciensis]MDE4122592.1 phage tail tube protein [Phaeobacter gallaeciensis]MDE4127259.1 phage tail tube protein [Phaeobacter gallaeciensis]
MAKQKGRAFLVKISDGAAGFTVFGGMTSKSLKINGERIDATTPDPTTPEGIMWRETLAGAKSVDASGDITLVGDAAEARAVTIAMGDPGTDDFEIVVPGVGTFAGTFSVDLEFGDDGKATASISLASTGAVTFTAF